MAELKTTLIKGSDFVKESNKRLAVRPPRAQEGAPSYAGEKSLKELNEYSNTAMGTLMALFYPECNAYRELAAWFKQDVSAKSPPSHIRCKFHDLYRQNKDVNLDTILKTGSLNKRQVVKLIKEIDRGDRTAHYGGLAL